MQVNNTVHWYSHNFQANPFFFRPSLLLLLFIFINIKYSEPLPSCNVLHLFKFVFHFFTAALYLSSHVVRRLQCKQFDVVYTPIYST